MLTGLPELWLETLSKQWGGSQLGGVCGRVTEQEEMNLELKDAGGHHLSREFIGLQRSEKDAKDGWGQAARGTIRVRVRDFIPRLLSKCSQGRQSCLNMSFNSAGCSTAAKSPFNWEQPPLIFPSSLRFLFGKFLFALRVHLAMFTFANLSQGSV